MANGAGPMLDSGQPVAVKGKESKGAWESKQEGVGEPSCGILAVRKGELDGVQGKEGRDQEGSEESGETWCPCFQRRWDLGFDDWPAGMEDHSHVHTSIPRGVRSVRSVFPTRYQEVWQLLCVHFCSTTLLIGRQLICIVYLMKPTMRVSKPFRSEAPGRGHGSGCWRVLDEEVNSMRSQRGTAVLWALCGSGWLGPVLWAGGQRAQGLGRTEGGVTDSSLAFPLPSSIVAVHAVPGKWRCWSPPCLLEWISGRSALERIVSPCHLIF